MDLTFQLRFIVVGILMSSIGTTVSEGNSAAVPGVDQVSLVIYMDIEDFGIEERDFKKWVAIIANKFCQEEDLSCLASPKYEQQHVNVSNIHVTGSLNESTGVDVLVVNTSDSRQAALTGAQLKLMFNNDALKKTLQDNFLHNYSFSHTVPGTQPPGNPSPPSRAGTIVAIIIITIIFVVIVGVVIVIRRKRQAAKKKMLMATYSNIINEAGGATPTFGRKGDERDAPAPGTTTSPANRGLGPAPVGEFDDVFADDDNDEMVNPYAEFSV